MTKFGSVTDRRPSSARQKWDSDFDESGPARHGIVTELGVQANGAQPSKNRRRTIATNDGMDETINEASPNPSSRPCGWTPWKLRSCRMHTIPLLKVWHWSFLPGWGRWEVGGEVFFFKLYLVWRVDRPCKFYLGREGGFIFLSTNGKAQGALLLFLLSLGGKKDFFSIFPYFPMCYHDVLLSS